MKYNIITYVCLKILVISLYNLTLKKKTMLSKKNEGIIKLLYKIIVVVKFRVSKYH